MAEWHMKRLYKEFNSSFSFKHVSVSLCYKTAERRHAELKEAIEVCPKSTQENLVALYCLLDELIAVSCMPFQAAFQEFAGKVPAIACNQIRKKLAVVQQFCIL